MLLKKVVELGIDLDAKDNNGWTALQHACNSGRTETVQMIMKNWKEFGIDIKAQNNVARIAREQRIRRFAPNLLQRM